MKMLCYRKKEGGVVYKSNLYTLWLYYYIVVNIKSKKRKYSDIVVDENANTNNSLEEDVEMEVD